MISDLPEVTTYRELLQRLDAWFLAAHHRHPDIIPCRTGCTACCHGPFDISAADVLLIRAGFERLTADQQRDVRDRAGVQLALMRQAEPGWGGAYAIGALGEDRFDQLAERLAGEPCPFLDDAGGCLIYQDRPMVCRMMGLSMRGAPDRVIDNACPIQERFPGYADLGPQDFDLESFEAVEFACLEAASLRLFNTPFGNQYETTIAAAIGAPRISHGHSATS